jgi:hypothetical protein
MRPQNEANSVPLTSYLHNKNHCNIHHTFTAPRHSTPRIGQSTATHTHCLFKQATVDPIVRFVREHSTKRNERKPRTIIGEGKLTCGKQAPVSIRHVFNAMSCAHWLAYEERPQECLRSGEGRHLRQAIPRPSSRN